MQNRYNVIKCNITKITMANAIDEAVSQVRNDKGGYVCFTNVHACVMARANKDFLEITNNSFMSLPDRKTCLLGWQAKRA